MAKRRQWSAALKRQMVAETLAPGSSVSIVARRHNVNTNQLFKWRRELLPKAVVESGTMVAVGVVAVEMAPEHDRKQRRVERTGVVEIEFGCGARVRLCGEVSFDRLAARISINPAATNNVNSGWYCVPKKMLSDGSSTASA
jgi:transposase